MKKKAQDIELELELAPEPETAAPAPEATAEPPIPDDEDEEEDDAPAQEERKPKAKLRKLTSDEDRNIGKHSHVSLASILGGDYLGSGWFRRNLLYILMVVCMVLIYVTGRYSCQQEMIRSKALTDTLNDRRYKALTRSAELKERMRRSYIEQNLPDSTLRTAVTPSYKLKVSE